MTAKSAPELLSALRSFEKGKIVSAREAVALIRDGDTVATGGFVGIGFAEGIAVALEELFLSGEAAHGQIERGTLRAVRRRRLNVGLRGRALFVHGDQSNSSEVPQRGRALHAC